MYGSEKVDINPLISMFYTQLSLLCKGQTNFGSIFIECWDNGLPYPV